MELVLICFIAVIVLVLLRVPIAIAMGLVGVIGYYFARGRGWNAAFSTARESVVDVMGSATLSVIPLFVFMGMIIARSGMAQDLYKASYSVVGRFRGGLAMSTVLACGGFSAVSGSSLATAATMAKVAMPPMRRFGYADSLSTASIAAGGTLGILIPPSIILIIYGFLTSQSIEKLFLAGILPGLLGIFLYLCAVISYVLIYPDAGPAGDRLPKAERRQAARAVLPILALFLFIFTGLYAGLFSTDEAGGMGAIGALVIAGALGKLSVAAVRESLVTTVTTTVTLFALLIGADIFKAFVSFADLPGALGQVIEAAQLAPMTVILAMMLIYVILGAVFESLSMITLTVPVFAPIVASLGLFGEGAAGVEMSLIWFGILVVVVTEISLITPPIGLNVFVLRGVVGDVSTGTVFKGVTAFWIFDLIRLTLLVSFPSISLFLPLSLS